MSRPLDLAGTVALVTGGKGGIAVFLASREAGFVTGAAIPVDGGYAAAI